MLSSSIHHSAVPQHSATSHAQSSEARTYVPVRVRQRKQADRVVESQYVVQHLDPAALCVLKSNEEIETCRGQKKNYDTTTSNYRYIYYRS